MKFTCLAFILYIAVGISTASAQSLKNVIIYEPTVTNLAIEAASSGQGQVGPVTNTTLASSSEKKVIKLNLFEKLLNEAIKSLENSMRGTCAKEIETSVALTADGQGIVFGVSLAGAIKLLVTNPDYSKKCVH